MRCLDLWLWFWYSQKHVKSPWKPTFDPYSQPKCNMSGVYMALLVRWGIPTNMMTLVIHNITCTISPIVVKNQVLPEQKTFRRVECSHHFRRTQIVENSFYPQAARCVTSLPSKKQYNCMLLYVNISISILNNI